MHTMIFKLKLFCSLLTLVLGFFGLYQEAQGDMARFEGKVWVGLFLAVTLPLFWGNWLYYEMFQSLKHQRLISLHTFNVIGLFWSVLIVSALLLRSIGVL